MSDVRQVIERTFTHIELLAAVVKIKGCAADKDKTLLHDLLGAVFGTESVERLLAFAKLPQLTVPAQDVRTYNDMFEALKKNFRSEQDPQGTDGPVQAPIIHDMTETRETLTPVMQSKTHKRTTTANGVASKKSRLERLA